MKISSPYYYASLNSTLRYVYSTHLQTNYYTILKLNFTFKSQVHHLSTHNSSKSNCDVKSHCKLTFSPIHLLRRKGFELILMWFWKGCEGLWKGPQVDKDSRPYRHGYAYYAHAYLAEFTSTYAQVWSGFLIGYQWCRKPTTIP
jgi:hypothetical protein